MKQFVLGLAITIPVTVLASPFSSPVEPEQFGQCIATLLNKMGGANILRKRQQEATETRALMLARSDFLKEGLRLGFPANHFQNENALAAIPLISSKRFTEDTATSRPLIHALFNEYCYKSDPRANCPIYPVDRADLPSVVDRYREKTKGFKMPQSTTDELFVKMHQVHSLADPIVDWLLKQPKKSVSHWTLLMHATETFDGDVLTAVGVLAELFYHEARSTRVRTRDAVLASKMQSLVPADAKYSAGHNYHFWRLISASFIRGGTLLARAVAFLEDNNIPSYRFANSLGVEVASAVFWEVGRNRRVCPLDQSHHQISTFRGRQ